MAGVKRAPNRLILTEFISGKTDTQRGGTVLTSDSVLPKASRLVESTKPFGVPVYVLTNDDLTYNTPDLVLTQVNGLEVFQNVSLYFLRWIMAYRFLAAHAEITEVVLTDLGDVEMLNNPFGQMKPGRLYLGDEFTDLAIDIVFQGTMPDQVNQFLRANQHVQLLNPGVIGGYRAEVLEFLGLMANLVVEQIYQHLVNDGSELRAYEMGMVNYVAYRYFPTRLRHGRQVSTIFFFNRSDSRSWFKHK
ncbi:hypothetical protein [Levilactobacillus bambusae]|uniref:Uncharacterized protein n=1 Tax=Levilactobacillus bambusae TaxID=2024736 RepID=A0A2V1MZJ8_9LACO|nr:hypothetical protein [Levilactobacillus bambusae]PWF99917.1 hypothetical protein DCM90_02900 [Levilactobacillus bambusae]